jgi:hypothetical protein
MKNKKSRVSSWDEATDQAVETVMQREARKAAWTVHTTQI